MKKLFLMLCLALVSVSAMAQGETKSWLLKFDFGGYSTQQSDKCLGDRDQALTFDFTANYNLTDHWAIGLGTGVWGNCGHELAGDYDANYVPLLANITYSFGNVSKKWNPYIQARGGYMFETCDSKLDVPNFGVLDGHFGVIYKINDTWGLNAAVMVQQFFKASGVGMDQTNAGAKIGFNLAF